MKNKYIYAESLFQLIRRYGNRLCGRSLLLQQMKVAVWLIKSKIKYPIATCIFTSDQDEKFTSLCGCVLLLTDICIYGAAQQVTAETSSFCCTVLLIQTYNTFTSVSVEVSSTTNVTFSFHFASIGEVPFPSCSTISTPTTPGVVSETEQSIILSTTIIANVHNVHKAIIIDWCTSERQEKAYKTQYGNNDNTSVTQSVTALRTCLSSSFAWKEKINYNKPYRRNHFHEMYSAPKSFDSSILQLSLIVQFQVDWAWGQASTSPEYAGEGQLSRNDFVNIGTWPPSLGFVPPPRSRIDLTTIIFL